MASSIVCLLLGFAGAVHGLQDFVTRRNKFIDFGK
jgi:hypothetical protein